MKIVKIQNEFKIISTMKPEEIKRLVKAGKNVLYDDKKPVFGINFSEHCSFTAKDATFNQVSDSGYAMLTVACDEAFYAQFASEEEAIKNFTEEYLAALTNLKAAEAEFTATLNNLNSNVNAIVNEIQTVNID